MPWAGVGAGPVGGSGSRSEGKENGSLRDHRPDEEPLFPRSFLNFVLLGSLVWLALAGSAASAAGEIPGCVSETGSGGACVDGTALDGATGVAMSPDGKSVYVASETSRAVAVFARDVTTGAITQLAGTLGCVSETGTGGACTDGTALVGPRSVAVSPDGKNFYFPSSFSAAVAVFKRDEATGVLTQLGGIDGCVSETGTGGACTDGTALGGARSVALSPDGKSVYVTAFFSNAVAIFSRDEATGKLIQLEGTAGCVSETGTGGACTDGTALEGARTVTVSPDGTSVYVVSETSGSVSTFARDGATGAITQIGGIAGCVSDTGSGGACTDGRALGGSAGVAVSPDGKHVYVASFGSDSVSTFARDAATGTLTQLAGTAGCVSETGTAGNCADGIALDRTRTVVVSPDGTSVYVASETSAAVAAFARDPVTGILTQLTGSSACVSETGTGGACADGTGLLSARSVIVSSDGKSAYVAAFSSSAVSAYARDLITGALTQLGSVVSSPPPPPVNQGSLFFSLRAAATLSGIKAANEDVLLFDGNTGFSLSFDGSDVGLKNLRVDAFTWLDGNSLLLSFDSAGAVPGVPGTIDDSDIVQFDASSLGDATSGTFRLYFDGSDVALTTDAHDIDAVEVLSDGRILISTTGSTSVTGATTGDEDLLLFTPTSLGDLTAGSFSLFFDGSDVGLLDSTEDIDAAAVDADGNIYLSTLGAFAVPGASGQDEDVFIFTPTALEPPTTTGSFASTLYFDGSTFGLDMNNVFAVDVP